jgi:hypothetical protein
MHTTKRSSKIVLACVTALVLFAGCDLDRYQVGAYRPATPASGDRVANYVNGLRYSYRAKEPVVLAFRAVTAQRGWSTAQTRSWETAMWDIALKEAQGCWNVRYGARFAHHDGRGCVLSRSGSGAAGYGQITKVALGPSCERVGICTQAGVVASPYHSMRALVATIEANGVRPWCYDGFSRRFHAVACNNPGLDVP